jgi:hypothetical protein
VLFNDPAERLLDDVRCTLFLHAITGSFDVRLYDEIVFRERVLFHVFKPDFRFTPNDTKR